MSRVALKNISRLIDAAKNELPVQEEFLADLKKSIELEDEQNRRKPSQTYKPSSMNCIRNMFYQRIGKDIDEGGSNYVGIGICNAGTDVHLRTQKAIAHMKKFGFDCSYIDVEKYVNKRELPYIKVVSHQGMETKLFNEKLQMSFLCDGILKYKKKYYGLEIKSESSFKWNGRISVDPSHFNQVTAYSISLNLPDWIFLYINRDNSDIKAFLYTPSSDMKHELVGKIEECEGYVKRLIAPPKPETIDRKTCEYCDYKSACRKEL